MNTPIYDFIKKYDEDNALRLHMPGHKGKSILGFEKYDITEFYGADSLFHPDGIIKESEDNLTSLYQTGRSFYSCEGSSLCIRAMLYLAMLHKGGGYIMAGRNAHSSLITASAMLDFDIKWLYSKEESSYICCKITPQALDEELTRAKELPFCVYVTSPDYLGNMCDIKSLSQVCEKHGVLLLVDNAHGAYLRFCQENMHPISLGAHMCCDSAHKTLPVLTGGAYLHISKKLPTSFLENGKSALSMFASTSPSYLILASLDRANEYLSTDFEQDLRSLFAEACELRSALLSKGYTLIGDEVIKITIDAKKYGYTGTDFASLLLKKGIVCEFYDEDFTVFMLSTMTSCEEIARLKAALLSIEKREPVAASQLSITQPKRVMSPRLACMSQRELISIEQANGRVLAGTNVFCPPAVSLIVAGEEFDQRAVDICKKYGFEKCFVVKKD